MMASIAAGDGGCGFRYTPRGAGALRQGDRIVFLGDSITEQQLYTNYVESYLAARFPGLGLSFFNAGWGGDTAPGGLARLGRDVLSLEPTLVTICFGMNDGRYARVDPAIRAEFASAMNGLVVRLEDARVRVVLLTPGMVDERAAPHLVAVEYNRGALRSLADEVLALASARSLPVADLHRLMNEVHERARAVDPGFCMIPDGVHPDAAGHLVMAHGLLTALGVSPSREWLEVDLASGAVLASAGLDAGKPGKAGEVPSVELRMARPPFHIEPEARKVLPYLPFRETWDSIMLRVRGLPGERCLLKSGRLYMGPLERSCLEAGVEMGGTWQGFPARQAERLHGITREKDQAWFRLWRDLALDPVDPAYHAPEILRAGIGIMAGYEEARRRLLGDVPAFRCGFELRDEVLPPVATGNLDFIADWCVLGPFPKPWDVDHLGGEADFSARVPELDSAWHACELDTEFPGANIAAILGRRTDCFAYLVTILRSPVAQDAELLVGSDDGVNAWLGGHSVLWNPDATRMLVPDQERVPVRLAAGDNVLLLKVTQGLGAWGACVRFSGLREPVATFRPPWK